MSKKKNNTPNPACTCKCDVCGMVDNATIPGTKHRRCSGVADRDRLPKHSVGNGTRGEWKAPT